MSWSEIPVPVRFEALRAYQTGGINAISVYTSTYRIKTNTLIRRLQELQKGIPTINLNIEIEQGNYRQELLVDCEDALIMGDFEIPDQSNPLLSYAKEVQRVYGIKNTFFIGDMLANEQSGVTSHENEIWATRQATYTECLDAAESVFKLFVQGEDDRGYSLTGNHDDMVSRMTGGQVDPNRFHKNLSDKITFTRFPRMFIRTQNRGLVRLSHPRKVSGDPILFAQKLFNSARLKSHIIMAHTHSGKRGWSADGLFEFIATGCMRDTDSTKYINITENPFNEWVPGFVLMLNGHFYPLFLYGTDWKRVLSGGVL